MTDQVGDKTMSRDDADRRQAQPVSDRRADESAAAPAQAQAAERPAALLASNEAGGFRSRWEVLQTGFVDDPRQSVQQADALVGEVMQRLADMFAHERERLEGQWSRGDDISTEDLRQALRRYRSFFDRLLSL